MHLFAKNPIDPEVLLEKSSLKEFVKRSRLIACSLEAKKYYEGSSYKDYEGDNNMSPAYFGNAIEFLAENFFEQFGVLFNLHGVESTSDWDSTEIDSGIDHTAFTLQPKKYGKAIAAEPNAPVFIQTKGTLRKDKMFTANDGSRIPNFMTYAQSQARIQGFAYQTRYILFTTGKGIHYRLDQMSGNSIEVINFNKIAKLIDGNEVFFNQMREALGVKQNNVVGRIDGEAQVFL